MPAQFPLSSSPYLEPHEAKQYRKHYKHLDNDAKLLLELHEFYTRPAKKGYCIIDDLLTIAYHPESIDNNAMDIMGGYLTAIGGLEPIGTCDFYNMPNKKGYVLGYNGILYTARLDRYDGEGIVKDMPEGFKGYFLTANVNQHGLINSIWSKVVNR